MEHPAGPPRHPDNSLAPKVIAVLTPLLTAALVMYSMRMFSRLRPPGRLCPDDHIMSLGMICAIAGWIVILAGVPYGSGRHTEYVDPHDITRVMELHFVLQILWIFAVTLIKVSLAFMILRIKNSKVWRLWMYGIVVVLVLTAIAALALQFTECMPIRAYWDHSVRDATCQSSTHMRNQIVSTSVVFILGDLVFAAIPVSFLYTLRRSLVERIILGLLMGLGIFASATGIVKLVKVHDADQMQDPLWQLLDLAMWSWCEVYVGIIAACAPTLKSLFERSLRKLGVHFSAGSNNFSMDRGSNLQHRGVAARIQSLKPTFLSHSQRHAADESESEDCLKPYQHTATNQSSPSKSPTTHTVYPMSSRPWELERPTDRTRPRMREREKELERNVFSDRARRIDVPIQAELFPPSSRAPMPRRQAQVYDASNRRSEPRNWSRPLATEPTSFYKV